MNQLKDRIAWVTGAGSGIACFSETPRTTTFASAAKSRPCSMRTEIRAVTSPDGDISAIRRAVSPAKRGFRPLVAQKRYAG